MLLKDLIKRLEKLKDKGFIETSRRGPTGIGHLLEQELGLNETNIAIPDVGGRVELKATRRHANSLITLFTFNRAVWTVKQKDLIVKFGYQDQKGRQALYSTVSNKTPNTQGFYLQLDAAKNLIILRHRDSEKNYAEWSTYVIVGKFMTKMDRIIMVLADNKQINGKEHFHCDEATLLEHPTPQKFLEAFHKSEMFIDLRMYLKESGAVRNHGTAFRMTEKNLSLLYSKQKKLI
jgi:hypothetical protein